MQIALLYSIKINKKVVLNSECHVGGTSHISFDAGCGGIRNLLDIFKVHSGLILSENPPKVET